MIIGFEKALGSGEHVIADFISFKINFQYFYKIYFSLTT
jgi:hypothetical protein